jgi:beta-1,4-mannosyltransferase
MIITGKGAGKSAFEKEVKELEKKWDWVRVRTAWLPFEDYPKLLGTYPRSDSCRWD